MAIASGPLQPAASNSASIPTVMPRPFGSVCGSPGYNISEQLAAWARTPIGRAFVISVGTLLGFGLMKLLALLGWAMDWSWLGDNPILRSGSDNCPKAAACLMAAGGAAGGSGGKHKSRGGKPPDKGPKDPAPGRGGGNPNPGNYTPTKGSDPLHDPALQNAQSQYSSHNPQPAPSQPDSGGGVNYSHVIQNWFWKP